MQNHTTHSVEQRAERAQRIFRAVIEAYWETVEKIGRDEAATIIASGGRRSRSTPEQRKCSA